MSAAIAVIFRSARACTKSTLVSGYSKLMNAVPGRNLPICASVGGWICTTTSADGVELVGRRLDGRADGAVVIVARERVLPGAGLDADFDLLGGEALDGVSRDRDARLA